MSNWSSSSRHRRLHRKAVPDGSYDFQRVLDEILTGDEEDFNNDNEEADQGEDEFVDGGRYTCYEDDFEEDDDDDKRRHDQRGYNDERLTSPNIEGENNNNNNNNDDNNNSLCAYSDCVLSQYEERGNYSAEEPRDVLSPSGIVIVDCYGNSLSYNESEESTPKNNSLKLPKIPHHGSKMGTSCSSNFYDRRDWHSVAEGNDFSKPGKRGRLLKKRSGSDPTPDVKSVPSPVCTCTCQQQGSVSAENGMEIKPFTKNSTDKRMSLSPNDISEKHGVQLTNNRLSPNVDSAGHVKLSRVVGSGKARATSGCDVSPHRLLTRRNNSPNGRTPAIEGGYSSAAQHVFRPKSHSWSNGKLGTKANFKTMGLSPAGPQKAVPISHITSNGSKAAVVAKASPTSTILPQCPVKFAVVKVHDPSCPLYEKPDEMPKISNSKIQSKLSMSLEIDDDLAPMSRPRAASESQTTRPRRILPRTPDSTGSGNLHEHAHVHWADEEKGSALYTSVFLSSIRPRSYSHGAMDSVPHRPILKKVTGF